ncbi:hypothetical protein NKG05_19455 [Oerskovia sp. M15]
MLHDEALRAVQDPAVPPAVLAQVAGEFPDLRPQVAAHPAAYPELLTWLAAGDDPAVDAVLAARFAAFAGSPGHSSCRTHGAPPFAAPYATAPHAPGAGAPYAPARTRPPRTRRSTR